MLSAVPVDVDVVDPGGNGCLEHQPRVASVRHADDDQVALPKGGLERPGVGCIHTDPDGAASIDLPIQLRCRSFCCGCVSACQDHIERFPPDKIPRGFETRAAVPSKDQDPGVALCQWEPLSHRQVASALRDKLSPRSA